MIVAGAALLAVSALAAAPAAERTLRVPLAASDVATHRYRYVPFDVPAGTTRIDVTLAFDGAGGATVIDLGLLEPGSLALHTRAYRGWSGGERSEIFVAVDDATPGYWPGPILPGAWHVQLGLYKVASAGAEAVVTVRTSSGPVGKAPALAARPARPLRREARWYAGALHTHTVHSDGKLTPAELAKDARAAGLDFLVITDHNNTAHQRDAIDVDGLLVFAGEEVTTPGGHASVWGLRGPRASVDFRVLPGENRIDSLVSAAHAQGALFSINHPFDNCAACSWTHDVPRGVDGIEISNPGASNMSQAIALWDTLLRAGRRVTAVGVSDWHRPGNADRTVDVASVRVFATELSQRAILEGIRGGRVIVMANGALPTPVFSASSARRKAAIGDTLALTAGDALRVEVGAGTAYAGGRVDLVWRGEKVASHVLEGDAPAILTQYPGADGYVRAHIFAADGTPLALTNPVWVSVRPK